MNAQQMRDFWDKAAGEPKYRERFISDPDISTDGCVKAITSAFQDLPDLKGKGALIVEIGCGYGRLTSAIMNLYPEAIVMGVDISPTVLKKAIEGPLYVTTPGTTLPDLDNSVDGIFSVQLFQHLPPDMKAAYIQEAERVLKPGGVFRFQYVEGETIAEMTYDAKFEDIVAVCQEAGFTEISADFNLLADRWTWITATKPQGAYI